jgi:hypothetical protein
MTSSELEPATSGLQHSASTTYATMCRGIVVCIANGYGLDDRGVRVQVPVGSRIFTSPYRPDRLRGLPNLLSNEYRWFFSLG